MQCPIDGNKLAITDRQGIEIDYCPDCRGVWLDRGELDKLIERADSGGREVRVAPERERHSEDRYRSYDDDDNRQYGHKKKRREGFLGDLFDF